jgi:hypothetical protein
MTESKPESRVNRLLVEILFLVEILLLVVVVEVVLVFIELVVLVVIFIVVEVFVLVISDLDVIGAHQHEALAALGTTEGVAFLEVRGVNLVEFALGAGRHTGSTCGANGAATFAGRAASSGECSEIRQNVGL